VRYCNDLVPFWDVPPHSEPGGMYPKQSWSRRAPHLTAGRLSDRPPARGQGLQCTRSHVLILHPGVSTADMTTERNGASVLSDSSDASRFLQTYLADWSQFGDREFALAYRTVNQVISSALDTARAVTRRGVNKDPTFPHLPNRG
jgi:hypothetical protein